MKIKFLKANNGDSILISFQDEKGINKNILIDGGIKKTYKTDKGSKGKPEFGELKETIDIIRNKEEFIDLLIITHNDNDHIGGILKWFDEDEDASIIIKEVWFNSGKRIAEFLEESENKDMINKIYPDKTTKTSENQGIDFSRYVTDKGIMYGDIISQGKEFKKFGLEFKILSPSRTKLELLLKNWKLKDPDLETATKPNDYNKSLKEHLEKDIFEEDDAYPNGSSIAFILIYNKQNFLFLGDSHPSIIISGLKLFDYCKENPIEAKLVKMPHHGSKKNTSIDLLKCINSNDYVISTDGTGDQHPHKQLLARLINEKQDCNIYFNYKERMDMIFTSKDNQEYPKFKKIAIIKEFEF